MAYTLTQARSEDISPKRAQEFLSKFNNFEGQRPINVPWVQHLAAKMQSGEFANGHIAFAENGTGGKFLVNGQHTLSASVLCGMTFRATIEDYHVEVKDDTWKLFGAFDTQRTRSQAQIMGAARGLFASKGLQGTDLRTLAVCGTALSFLGAGITPNFAIRPLDKTTKPALIQKYESDVLFYSSVLEGAGVDPSQVVTMACCCVIATGRIDQKKAFNFWTRVLGGFDLERGTAEWRLNRDIESGLVARAGYKGGGRNQAVWNLCSCWWNSFITKTPRKAVKLGSIKGTVELLKAK